MKLIEIDYSLKNQDKTTIGYMVNSGKREIAVMLNFDDRHHLSFGISFDRSWTMKVNIYSFDAIITVENMTDNVEYHLDDLGLTKEQVIEKAKKDFIAKLEQDVYDNTISGDDLYDNYHYNHEDIL